MDNSMIGYAAVIALMSGRDKKWKAGEKVVAGRQPQDDLHAMLAKVSKQINEVTSSKAGGWVVSDVLFQKAAQCSEPNAGWKIEELIEKGQEAIDSVKLNGVDWNVVPLNLKEISKEQADMLNELCSVDKLVLRPHTAWDDDFDKITQVKDDPIDVARELANKDRNKFNKAVRVAKLQSGDYRFIAFARSYFSEKNDTSLARFASIDRSSVSQIKLGRDQMSRGVATKLASLCGVELAFVEKLIGRKFK